MNRNTSAAYLAMTKAARHMLEMIEREIGDSDSVAIRVVDFVDMGIPQGSCGYSLR